MENKQQILNLFLKTIKETRHCKDIKALEYKKDTEYYKETVTIKFDNGKEKTVNVTADSGLAMIEDVLKRLW